MCCIERSVVQEELTPRSNVCVPVEEQGHVERELVEMHVVENS